MRVDQTALLTAPADGEAALQSDPGRTMPWPGAARVAVLIPCHNEAAAIGKVVADFRAALPRAEIFVYDNNSTDATAAVAAAAGARVRRERLQGKGHVVRRMFADIEADVFVLVDGDDTYEAAAAPALLRLLSEDRLDMVIATRVTDIQAAYRPGHRFGNRLLTGIVAGIFGNRVTDMLSGYRVFSRRFVKTFPALATGFETETELTVHALELHMAIGERATAYRDRPAGSASKLRTWRDGARILRSIVILVKEEKPLAFFGLAALALAWTGLGLGLPVVREFFATGLVPRLPTAVLAMGFVLLSFLSLAAGLILDSVARGRREVKRLAYLAVPGPP
jgi:glycosyltransferase involved in cell wall biosynthesis